MTYELICDMCGKEIVGNTYEHGENVFCSNKCAGDFDRMEELKLGYETQ